MAEHFKSTGISMSVPGDSTPAPGGVPPPSELEQAKEALAYWEAWAAKQFLVLLESREEQHIQFLRATVKRLEAQSMSSDPTPEPAQCSRCEGLGDLVWPSEDGGSPRMECPDCKGTGKKPPRPSPAGVPEPTPARSIAAVAKAIIQALREEHQKEIADLTASRDAERRARLAAEEMLLSLRRCEVCDCWYDNPNGATCRCGVARLTESRAEIAGQRDAALAENAALKAELAEWRPLTAEEAEAAYAAAEAVPMSEERIQEILAFATNPANQLPNSQQMQLAIDNRRLKAERDKLALDLDAAFARIAAQSELLGQRADRRVDGGTRADVNKALPTDGRT